MENEKLFFSIKEVAALLNEPAHTLRYWEREFPEALKPARRKDGNKLEPSDKTRGVRYYSESDIEQLRFIRYLLRDRGLTIEGVRKKLKHNTEEAEIRAKVIFRLTNIRAELKALEDGLNKAAFFDSEA